MRVGRQYCPLAIKRLILGRELPEATPRSIWTDALVVMGCRLEVKVYETRRVLVEDNQY
jgi:hypothetical protein